MATQVVTVKDQLKAILGKDSVLDSPEVIEQYGRDYSLEPPRSFTCVVRPQNVNEGTAQAQNL